MIKIKKAYSNFESEPLLHPFGFKGGAMNKIWQYVVYLESEDGISATGVGVQGVLWSDSRVFAENSPSAGCAMMYLITEYALRLIRGQSYENPIKMLERILPEVTEYAIQVTSNPGLRKTFVLNALVAVDQALWILYERTNKLQGFDSIIPDKVEKYLQHRYERMAVIPLITYGTSIDEVKYLANNGCPILKIKIGSDPEGDGNQDKMLEWDKNRLTQIHEAVKHIKSQCTDCGYVTYYMDANGRYDSKERLKTLLEHVREIGAIDRVVVVEEPFSEDDKFDVSDIPVPVAADESAHSTEDVIERIELGYKIIALKPIAKTMSITFQMIEAAASRGVPCFCADLTVNPLMVDVNKCFAARLGILPGLRIPAVESNGGQNYRNWGKMKSYHPCPDAPWVDTVEGLFHLDNGFYEKSGGIFNEYTYYQKLAVEK